jgi:threonine efflux protein
MISTLLTIGFLHWLVLLLPGANFLLVGQLAASGKRTTACAAAFGVTTVTFTWATLAILGIGLVFSAHPAWRQALQLAGGVYLCHLGWKLWRSRGITTKNADIQLSNGAAFRLGFITNILNPKTALFFGSVFATALPANASLALVVSAIALVYINALVWHLFLALAFSHPRVQTAYARHTALFSKLAGVLVGAFGAKLIVATLQEFRAKVV